MDPTSAPDPRPDPDLLAAVAAWDGDAFTALVLRHHGMVVGDGVPGVVPLPLTRGPRRGQSPTRSRRTASAVVSSPQAAMAATAPVKPRATSLAR
ncbi:MAG: hypothetical protein RLZZ127_2536 [Planctomycetota bacterium]